MLHQGRRSCCGWRRWPPSPEFKTVFSLQYGRPGRQRAVTRVHFSLRPSYSSGRSYRLYDGRVIITRQWPRAKDIHEVRMCQLCGQGRRRMQLRALNSCCRPNISKLLCQYTSTNTTYTAYKRSNTGANSSPYNVYLARSMLRPTFVLILLVVILSCMQGKGRDGVEGRWKRIT